MLLKPLTTTTCSRRASSGFRIGVSSYELPPLPAGWKFGRNMPLGTYTNPRRWGAVDVVAADGTGSMASRNGSEIAAPTPRMSVRRLSDSLVMIIGQILNSWAASVVATQSLTRDGRLQRRRAI